MITINKNVAKLRKDGERMGKEAITNMDKKIKKLTEVSKVAKTESAKKAAFA